MCPMDCSCMIDFIEVPEVKLLSKYWGLRPLQPLEKGYSRDVDAYDRKSLYDTIRYDTRCYFNVRSA